MYEHICSVCLDRKLTQNHKSNVLIEPSMHEHDERVMEICPTKPSCMHRMSIQLSQTMHEPYGMSYRDVCN